MSADGSAAQIDAAASASGSPAADGQTGIVGPVASAGNAPAAAGLLEVSRAEFERRLIRPEEFVADAEAFVDVRLPRSQGKLSYSMIGAGVSQNAHQTVNLAEPHGFGIGAATMPHGVVNNPHMHYTAEVFICTSGSFRMSIGEHGEQTLDLSEGDVFATPTWVFRGFENIGGDDGWLFTVLGGDETGGIIWAPHVLKAAAETGLYLAADHSVVEVNGSEPPPGLLRALTTEQLAHTDSYSDAQLAERVVRRSSLDWHRHGLASCVLASHRSAVAPVIGHGMTEHRGHLAPVGVAHGFSVEWLRIAPGSQTGLHRHSDSSVLLAVDGDFEVSLNLSDRLSERIDPGSVVSVPPDAWRSFANVGSCDAHAVVVNGGDHRNRIQWEPSLLAEIAEAGYGHDACGFLAPLELIGKPVP